MRKGRTLLANNILSIPSFLFLSTSLYIPRGGREGEGGGGGEREGERERGRYREREREGRRKGDGEREREREEMEGEGRDGGREEGKSITVEIHLCNARINSYMYIKFGSACELG